MPNIKSAKKRVRVIKTKTLKNKTLKTNLKSQLKTASVALENKSEDRAVAVKAAIKKIDQLVSKGILHKNTAARKKSQLALKLNKTNA